MELQLEMYICVRCKILLMIVHTQYHVSQAGLMNEDGFYEEARDSESEYLDTLCPVCSGSACGIESKDVTLKEIYIKRELFTDLNHIWNDIQNNISAKDTEGMIYGSVGIPLSNSKLKELLTEELL